MNYDKTLILKVPSELMERLLKAATKKMMTRSEYVRQAVIAALEFDGE